MNPINLSFLFFFFEIFFVYISCSSALGWMVTLQGDHITVYIFNMLGFRFCG